jgi:preprotein translocase subunit SecE
MSKVNNVFSSLKNFFHEVKVEIKKTTWPSKDELIGSVTIVCILVFVFAVILGGMDASFSYVIQRFIS